MRSTLLHMLKARMVLHLHLQLRLRLHHRVFRRGCDTLIPSLICYPLVIIIVVSSTNLVREVCRTLVLVRAAIVLEPPQYLIDVR